MRRTASIGIAVLAVVIGGVLCAPAAYADDALAFLVVPHQNGRLALAVSQIRSAWYAPGADGGAPQLRLVGPAVGEAKSLAGPDADAAWKILHDGALAARFVFVSHMGGTLGIPRGQIASAYWVENGGQPRLRLVYEGDSAGKELTGDEASRVWQALAG